jgi:hypothetical protein
MKKLIYFSLIFLAFTGCSKKNNAVDNSVLDELIINPIIIDDLTFNLADDYTIEWSLWVNNYIEKFLELSPEILENKSEIEYAVCQIKNIPEAHAIYQELGWTKVIEIKIKIKDETTLPIDWNIAGAELFYYLGSGRVPGCLVQTKQEHLFSGFVNEAISVVTDNSFASIDRITPYTFKKQTPQITSKKFCQVFHEQFIKFGGRQLDAWTETKISKILKIEKNLILNLWLIDDDDSLLDIFLRYNDTTEPLLYKDDFHIALCAMISIAEPYLEGYQVEQFATTLEKAKSQQYWMPSGNNYTAAIRDNSFDVSISFETEN